MRNWDEVYKKEFRSTWFPSDPIVRLVARYLKRRIGIDLYDVKKDVRRILDVGCGNGNHAIFLAELGYDVYGIDVSGEAIEIAKAWFNKRGLKADLRVGDVEKLPYRYGYFDVIISHAVLDHISFSKAKKAISKMKKLCMKGGYIFITLRSTEDSEFGRGRKVGENNTFELENGYEKGLIQHYFDLEEIKELFKEFKVFDVELYEEKYPDVFGVDKSFLQSSQGLKQYVDLSHMGEIGLKSSRWCIAAEKA